MKQYRFTGSPGSSALRLSDVPLPQPEAGQVLIKVHAVSLNYRDVLLSSGKYSRTIKPVVPCSDGAGEVVEAGAGVTQWKPGDRVMANFFEEWRAGGQSAEGNSTALGGERDGMLAEYVLRDANSLVHIPPHLSYEEASTLPCAAVTAWNALVVSGRIVAGDTVLLLGTGGVSIFGLQFARLHGARILVTSSSGDKLKRAAQLGAHGGINYRDTPEWSKEVLEMTDGKGVDHVLEVGGPGTLAQSIRSVRVGGHVALIGVLAGQGSVDPTPILMRSIRLQGIFVGSVDMFDSMARAIATAKLKPVIDHSYSFDEAPKAIEDMAQGNHFGKLVIKV